ncbi:hypothetical protein HYQ46_005985 [Verticillium longisporum]|nr:hypothetical protein HYQ46_005985 [Verticillium longisporum]
MPVQDKLGPPGVSPLSRNPGQGLTEPDLRASAVGSLACAAAAHLPSVNPRVAETRDEKQRGRIAQKSRRSTESRAINKEERGPGPSFQKWRAEWMPGGGGPPRKQQGPEQGKGQKKKGVEEEIFQSLSFIRARDTFLDDEIGKHSNQSPHSHLVAQGRRALLHCRGDIHLFISHFW